MELEVRNVNDAYVNGMALLKAVGIKEDSRNGPVIVYPEPVVTIYERPMERVLFNAFRDANPFFHIFEAMWMLCGRRDVEFLAKFNPRMKEYSDDGHTLYGAYGYRWRHPHGENIDQIDQIVHQLRQDMDSRRAVLAMWDASDLFIRSKDIPCNTHIYFRVQQPEDECCRSLDMTVCCRSNDIIWGAYGANSVHFSILQEYVAAGLHMPMGRMYQMSNNYHAYVELFDKNIEHIDDTWLQYGIIQPTPIVIDYWSFIHELRRVLDVVAGLNVTMLPEHHNPFMEVLFKLSTAWNFYKEKDIGKALYTIATISGADDWRLACQQWLERRQ